MRPALLDVLRCPFCGGRFSLVRELFHREDADGLIQDGLLGCHCCLFAVVDGIPVLHLLPPAPEAHAHMQAGDPDAALRAMLGLVTTEQAAGVEALRSDPRITYRDAIAAMDLGLEGNYFFHRFCDPTFVVADAVLRAVAAPVLAEGVRAIDVCGGSGHLTRTLEAYSAQPPVFADLSFRKLWLARRFVATGSEPVCADANGPLPFAAGSFGFAQCTDALMFLWTKRRFIGELERLVDRRDAGTVLVGHAHNALVWSPSHGQALTADAYAALFERMPVRLFGEHALFDDLVAGQTVDLSRLDTATTLADDAAFTMIATRRRDVFHKVQPSVSLQATGRFHLNPLYAARDDSGREFELRFPSEVYEDEFGAALRYLPPTVTLDPDLVARLPARELLPADLDWVRRRVILDLPDGYL